MKKTGMTWKGARKSSTIRCCAFRLSSVHRPPGGSRLVPAAGYHDHLIVGTLLPAFVREKMESANSKVTGHALPRCHQFLSISTTHKVGTYRVLTTWIPPCIADLYELRPTIYICCWSASPRSSKHDPTHGLAMNWTGGAHSGVRKRSTRDDLARQKEHFARLRMRRDAANGTMETNNKAAAS